MKSEAATRVQRFFAGLQPTWAVVLTSFGLDESVLAELLELDPHVGGRRTHVFFDVVRHLNPGFVRHSASHVFLRPVHLETASGPFRCPVFHSKVWLAIDERKRVRRLAVLSANLTRWHLDDRGAAWDTFWMAAGIDLPLPASPLFGYLGTTKKIERVPLKSSETWRVDARNGLGFTTHQEAAGKLILQALNGSVATHAAAPFMNKTVISALGGEHCEARSGISGTGQTLHAKIVIAPKLTIAGSVNLTAQATRLPPPKRNTGAPVNHETVLLLAKSNSTLIQQIRKFPKADLLDGSSPPGDSDGDGTDWSVAKALAVAAPDRISFFARSESDFGLEFESPRGRQTKVRVVPNDKTKPSISLSVDGKFAYPSKRVKSAFLTALLDPPAFVTGTGADGRWRAEVDLGPLWAVVKRRKSLTDQDSSSSGTGRSGGAKGPMNDEKLTDIRSLRDQVIALGVDNETVLGVLRKHHPDYGIFSDIPEWMLDLRARTKGSSS
jgi:hypothetical protein